MIKKIWIFRYFFYFNCIYVSKVRYNLNFYRSIFFCFLGFFGLLGVGKSIFIEIFGKFLIEKDYKVVVLAVDLLLFRIGGKID